MVRGKCNLELDNSNCSMLEDINSELNKAHFDQDVIDEYIEETVQLLDDYAFGLGDGIQVDYLIRRRLTRIDLQIRIAGDKYDPFDNGKNVRRRIFERDFNISLDNETANINYAYVFGSNVATLSIPLASKKKTILSDPVIWSAILGIVGGLIINQLPETANSFIIDDIVSPLMSTVLGAIAGVMGPVIFVSLISSVLATGSVNELTDMGFKVVRRFIGLTLYTAILSALVSSFFFGTFGEGNVDFSPTQIIDMIIGIIPTNIVEPFLENNMPQIVVMALVCGVALLIIGDKAKDVRDLTREVNAWIMSIMRLVMMVIPAIPFLGIIKFVGKGDGAKLLEGWKFIAASYIIYILLLVIKTVKVSLVTKKSIAELIRQIKPVFVIALTTGSATAPVKQGFELSSKDFHIKDSYSYFWIPMCSAMFSLKTTVNLVVSAFMMASITGEPISLEFIFVMLIIVLELSLASPGTTSGWTIMFKSMNMTTEYVGALTTYRLFTNNIEAACTFSYNMFESLESAYRLGQIEEEDTKQEQANVS